MKRCAAAVICFHVAGDYRFWARDPREIFANNVQGTINVLEAAKAAGVGENRLHQHDRHSGTRHTRTARDRGTPRVAFVVQGSLQALEVRSVPRSAAARRGRLADRDRAADCADRSARSEANADRNDHRAVSERSDPDARADRLELRRRPAMRARASARDGSRATRRALSARRREPLVRRVPPAGGAVSAAIARRACTLRIG